MIRVGSTVKTEAGILGSVVDIVKTSFSPSFPDDDEVDKVFLAGHKFPYLRWQLTEIGKPSVIDQIRATKAPEVDSFCMKSQGTPIVGAEDSDWFVIVKTRSGNIDWCNLNPIEGAVVLRNKGYKGLGTLAECKAFVQRAGTADRYFIFKLSEWRFTNLD